MRFLLLTAFSVVFSLNSYSQAWVDVGLKGGYGLTQLINPNVWNDPLVVNKLSFGSSFGGKLGLNFNLKYQITMDFLYSSAKQTYEFQPSNTSNFWEKQVTSHAFDMPLLFRHNAESGSYLEIGPQISFLSGFEQTELGQNRNIDNYFNKTNLGVVVGIGSFMLGSNNTYLVFGIRAHYGFQDLLSNEGGNGSDTPFPINNGEMDGQDGDYKYNDYKSTNPLTIRAYLELNYDLAYLVRSNCKRTALKFF